VLEIVEDDEEMPVADVIPDKFGERRCSGFTDAERLRQGGEHKRWIPQWGQSHERNAVTESRLYSTSCCHSEAALPDATGASQGHEGDIGIAKETAKIGQLALAADQRRARRGQRGELASSQSRRHGVYLVV
jgi:hypothetical protein